MKYFTVGPVEMDKETLELAGKQLPYFRNDEFSKVMLENENKIKEIVNAKAEDRVIFLTGSGTSAMDAVVGHCSSGEHAIVINGGSFGKRFCELCSFYNVDHEIINVGLEENLTLQHFENVDLDAADILLVNMHETSCGKLYDMQMIGELCKKHNIKLVVDAISSFLADPIDMEDMNIDCLITSSHKALGLEPGLAIIVMKEKFIKENVMKKNSHNYYLDLKSHLTNMNRGQTPFTPAISVCLGLNEKLKRINANEKISKTKELADYFRKKINYNYPSYNLSNALTPLYFDDKNAKNIYHKLLDKGICLNPCGGELADIMLRVSHIGNLSKSDYDNLIFILEEVSK